MQASTYNPFILFDTCVSQDSKAWSLQVHYPEFMPEYRKVNYSSGEFYQILVACNANTRVYYISFFFT